MSLQIRIIHPERPPPRGRLTHVLRAVVMLGIWVLVALAALAVSHRLLG